MIKNSNTAFVFDIQRSSFVDGPGMRTTIFFKGCNLSCEWCHNPEGINCKKQLLFYKEKCTSCGACKNVCENNFNNCIACGKCAKVCLNEARVVCGKEYTISELINEILKDKLFYETTGGGVTFSGGECMLQVEVLKELLIAVKKENIHTAVDTAGNVPFASFEKIIEFTDLFLYDLKFISKDLHKKYTGVDNSLILENLKKIIELGKEVLIRIPIVCNVNDSFNEIKKIKNFLDSINFTGKVELLPYHKMGENKTLALGKTPKQFFSPSKENIELLKNIFI